MQREAIVTGGARNLDEVRAYLPSNYQADEVIVNRTDWAVEPYRQEVRILIHGEDMAGWTLDGYVIPRLASGLIFAEEVKDEPTQ